MPLLRPFLSGMTDRLRERSRPYVRVAVGVIAGTHLTAFLLGRLSKRKT